MAPLAWIRRIASVLPELNTIPLFGNSPPFDWEHFSSSLTSQLESSSPLRIQAGKGRWEEGIEIKKEGSRMHLLQISILPLGTLYWLMSQEDVAKITFWMMKANHPNKAFFSDILQEGFYRFLALHALSSLQEMEPFSQLSLQFVEEEPVFEEAVFCLDVEINIEQKSCWGSLVIPKTFQAHWVHHFSHTPPTFPPKMAQQIEVPLGVKIGSFSFSQKEWKSIKEGDFLPLSSSSYDLAQEKGSFVLMLQGTSLFKGKMKQGTIELTDYSFYDEDSMEQKKAPSKEGGEEEIVPIKEIPLCVNVEIARLTMSVEQLMQLSPGNTLELPTHADEGVCLTVNGHKIGKAELIYLGEQLGIRILEI